MFMFIIILVSLLLGVYCHFAFKRHVINPYQMPMSLLFIFDGILIFSTFFRYIYRFQNNFTQHELMIILIKLSYVTLSFLGFLIFYFLILDFFKLLAKFKIPTYPKYAPNLERRAFLTNILSIGGFISVGAATAQGYTSSFNPQVAETDIPLSNAHSELDGLKILQLSDVHIGPTLGREFAEKIVELANAQKPDLIAITGDFVDGNYEYLKHDLEPFSRLEAPLGVFFVTGNHEFYWGGEVWLESVEKLGMIPLPNKSQVLSYKNTSFAIAGVNDLSTIRSGHENKHNPEKAIEGLDPNLYKIILAHQPNSCIDTSPLGFHLQLSGHTHAGQAYPFKFLVQLVQKYMQGLYDVNGMWLYVNAGTGFWGPPNRLGVNSEISVLTLKKIMT